MRGSLKFKTLTLFITLALALTLTAPALAQGSTTHVVQPGENLFRIGLRYGVTVNAITAANGLSNPSRIYVGQRLVIPSSTSSGRSSGGSPSSPSAPSSGVHVVQPGENLYRIALRYGTTYQALSAANGIVNPNRIYVGQRLNIPPSTSSGRSSGGAAPSGPSLPPSGGHSGRWIDVDLSAQRVTAYQGNTALRSTYASTGRSYTPTPTGQYRIYVKYTYADMSGPGYYLPNVPYVMYFHRGYSFHGTYWHSNFGVPMSHGCVNLPTSEAQWLYSWASVGTLVNIHY